jgi:hypothetical protein
LGEQGKKSAEQGDKSPDQGIKSADQRMPAKTGFTNASLRRRLDWDLPRLKQVSVMLTHPSAEFVTGLRPIRPG